MSLACSCGKIIPLNGPMRNFHSEHHGEKISNVFCFKCKKYNLYIYDKKILDCYFTCSCKLSIDSNLSKYSEYIDLTSIPWNPYAWNKKISIKPYQHNTNQQ